MWRENLGIVMTGSALIRILSSINVEIEPCCQTEVATGGRRWSSLRKTKVERMRSVFHKEDEQVNGLSVVCRVQFYCKYPTKSLLPSSISKTDTLDGSVAKALRLRCFLRGNEVICGVTICALVGSTVSAVQLGKR